MCLCVQVYNVHYSMSINGKVEEGTMEIDTANNMERFSTGSGADEAVEVHDFEIVSRTRTNPKKRPEIGMKSDSAIIPTPFFPNS